MQCNEAKAVLDKE